MDIVLHGGAGTAPDEPAARRAALAEAAEEASAREAPLDAACAATRALERDPLFNAGVGSAVQSDGRIRTDAGLMTAAGTVGAVAAVPGFVRAADAARVVAEETPHVLIAGERARDLATAFDVPDEGDCWSDRTRERWAAADPPAADSPVAESSGDGAGEAGVGEQLAWLGERFGEDETSDRRAAESGTVGAVATDGDALAAVTSTGGRWFALAGRVGDVPQVGAGFYADGRGGASATGDGEAIARFGLARRAVAELERFGPEKAAEGAVEAFAAATDARAGVIVLDPAGHVGRATNAESMQTAVESSDER